tara:strand:+ start:3256 stop:3450 length:195 start_codon:yes stop_codon:yes gene_type:complete
MNKGQHHLIMYLVMILITAGLFCLVACFIFQMPELFLLAILLLFGGLIWGSSMPPPLTDELERE